MIKKKDSNNTSNCFQVRQVLEGHSELVRCIAWSPDGLTLASGSADGNLQFWDIQSFQVRQVLEGHSELVRCIAWSPDGLTLASGSADGTLRLWQAQTGVLLRKINAGFIVSMAWSPDGAILAAGYYDYTIRFWDTRSGRLLNVDIRHSNSVYAVAWSPDGLMLASGSSDQSVRLWNKAGHPLRTLAQHTGTVNTIAWSPDGLTLASGSSDRTIRLWDPTTGQQKSIIEGHTNSISYISFSSDGQFIISESCDSTVRIWRSNMWEMVATLDHIHSDASFSGSSLHGELPVLATVGEKGQGIHIWDLDVELLLRMASFLPSVRYTNAKVVLLGDSGVGKSGLGFVLSGQQYRLTESTHGRRIWIFDSQEVDLIGGFKERREILLWDMAGQPGYRVIHQLHLNEVTVALIIFDAHSETDPFAGVHHWVRALHQAQRTQGDSTLPLKKILVSARIDRGGISVSLDRIKLLMQELNFDNYFETSAKEGWQIAELQQAIQEAIDWEKLPKVSSTELFQNIKDFLVSEKEAGRPLSTSDDLYHTFLRFSGISSKKIDLRAQFETCIGRVESAGLIKRLSFGKLILLQPELLDAYASALINFVRDEPDGLGSILEEKVRSCSFRMPRDEQLLDKEHEKLLLIAMIEDLLRRELVLREEAYLVFPSQSTRENPDLPEPEGKSIIFDFEGPVLNIYATLAVRLSHSGFFKKKSIWKNAMIYTTKTGGTCGMFLRNFGEGRGELTLFFEKTTSEETRRYYEDYVQIHLQRHVVQESLKRRRIFVCSDCGFVVSDQLVQLLQERGIDSLICPVPGCNTSILLIDQEDGWSITPSSRIIEMDRAADSKRNSEVNKSTIEGKKETKDFDVFLCYNEEDRNNIRRIGERLKEMGILPWLDEWELRPGLLWQSELEKQIEKIKSAAVFVGKNGIGPWQRQEIEAFLREFTNRGCPVIPVLLAEAPKEPHLPIFLKGMTWVDFRQGFRHTTRHRETVDMTRYQEIPDPMKRLIWGITGKHEIEHA